MDPTGTHFRWFFHHCILFATKLRSYRGFSYCELARYCLQTSPYWCYIWQDTSGNPAPCHQQINIQNSMIWVLWERIVEYFPPKLAFGNPTVFHYPASIHFGGSPSVGKTQGKWYTQTEINLPRLCHLGFILEHMPVGVSHWSLGTDSGNKPCWHSSYHFESDLNKQTISDLPNRVLLSKWPDIMRAFRVSQSHCSCRYAKWVIRDSPWPNKSDLIAKTELVTDNVLYESRSDSYITAEMIFCKQWRWKSQNVKGFKLEQFSLQCSTYCYSTNRPSTNFNYGYW